MPNQISPSRGAADDDTLRIDSHGPALGFALFDCVSQRRDMLSWYLPTSMRRMNHSTHVEKDTLEP